MRAVIRRAAISAVAALFALPSIAGPVVYEVISPVQLLKVLQAEDRSITLNDSAGDATISGGVSGHPFDIYLDMIFYLREDFQGFYHFVH